MNPQIDTQRIFHLSSAPALALDVQSFLLDVQARNLASGTIRFYSQKLYPLVSFLERMGLPQAELVTSAHLRLWFVHLQETGHNPGGVHGFYRAAKAFFTWLAQEEAISRNPMARIKAPKVPDEQLQPVTIEQVKALLAACDPKTKVGTRDRAIILCLWDSGCGEADAGPCRRRWRRWRRWPGSNWRACPGLNCGTSTWQPSGPGYPGRAPEAGRDGGHRALHPTRSAAVLCLGPAGCGSRHCHGGQHGRARIHRDDPTLRPTRGICQEASRAEPACAVSREKGERRVRRNGGLRICQ